MFLLSEEEFWSQETSSSTTLDHCQNIFFLQVAGTRKRTQNITLEHTKKGVEREHKT
jgi:hypothetical protein